jgi:hypothetical protein
MNSFPEHLLPERKEDFTIIRKEILINQMRKDIYDLMIKGNENDFFDLVVFRNRYQLTSSEVREIADILISELNERGWKTVLSYADTGLFIFSTENPPPGAW